MSTQHYAILSTGEYSDYSPTYYVGTYELTQSEFDTQAKLFAKECRVWFELLPERKHKCKNTWCCMSSRKQLTEKYDPLTGEEVFSPFDEDRWTKKMDEWLKSLGFTELPEDIPEINVCYGEYPS